MSVPILSKQPSDQESKHCRRAKKERRSKYYGDSQTTRSRMSSRRVVRQSIPKDRVKTEQQLGQYGAYDNTQHMRADEGGCN